MNNWMLEILRNPKTGKPFSLLGNDKLVDEDGVMFPIFNDVPVFLEQQSSGSESETTFKYVEHYTKDAEVFDYHRERDRLYKVNAELLHHRVISEIPKGAKLLLDVGCGSAFIAKHFMGKETCVVSLDIARVNAEKAVKMYPSERHSSVVADVFALPFAASSFDCIVASEIIEHTVDPKDFIEALSVLLKPNGVLIVSAPYKEKLEYSLCIHCNCPTPKNAHLHSLDEEKMKALVAEVPAVSIEKIRLVGNKLLLYSRMVLALRAMGFAVLKMMDRIVNVVIPKSQHFVIKLTRII